MKNNIPRSILSIDLGKIMGAAVAVDGEIEYVEEYGFTSLGPFHKWAKELTMRWKPTLILVPYPTRFYNTIMSHGKMIGVVELLAEQKNITVIECQDKTCKKVVIGKGNAKKEDIYKHYQETGLVDELEYPSEHILDSVMFIHWYLKTLEE